MEEADRQSCRLTASVHLQNTSKKLIQESDQHLENVGKILHNGYLVPDWAPKVREKQMVAFVNDLHCQGPPNPPMASKPSRQKSFFNRVIEFNQNA